MNYITKELWLKNYRGEGDTAELESFLKKITNEKGNFDINYLPWAVVERIFKLQGGTYEVLRTEKDSIVDADVLLLKEDVDVASGVVEKKYAKAYFINVRVNWLGLEYIERYPLQGLRNAPLTNWTQNELNKSVQRAKVKAIANISGIGYKLFESGDLQFDDDDGKNTTAEKTVSKQLENVKNLKKSTEKEKTKLEPKKVETKTEKVEKKVELKKEETKPETTPEEIIEEKNPFEELVEEVKVVKTRKEMENDIKTAFIKNGYSVQEQVHGFLKENKTLKVGELTEAQVKELYILLNLE